MYSQRSAFTNLHYRAGLYEFEDIIREVDSVDLFVPHPGRWFEYRTRLANRLAVDWQTTINPGIGGARLERDYDLFVAVVQFPRDLLHIKYLQGWKERCRTSVCWLNEIYVSDLPTSRHYLSQLSRFDYIILQQTGSIAPVEQLIGKKCTYQPSGVDALLFCPFPDSPHRAIDVYSIGRRSQTTHEALLQMARNRQLFYIYDSLKGEQVRHPEEHRFLYASMAKRSRYFVVNRGNVDKPGEAAQVEFGNRFFEGAAAGTMMIGERPRNEAFDVIFDWEDAVIDVPFGAENIGVLIEAIDRDPERQERIRRTNVVRSLLRHDWVYRWETLLTLAGVQPTAALLNRKQRLATMAVNASADVKVNGIATSAKATV
jgi:hypothetical protein